MSSTLAYCSAYHTFVRKPTSHRLVTSPPAQVNWHEAKAFCAWRGERDGSSYRLTTEAESVRLRERSDELAALRGSTSDVRHDPAMAGDGSVLGVCTYAHMHPW